MSSDRSSVPSDPLSVCTFNILAPCYKRLSSEVDREGAHGEVWRLRHQAIVDLLLSLKIDVICLQEFWLKRRAFVGLYESRLSSRYSFHYIQRTGDLEDGLAILVDRTQLTVQDQCDLRLNDIGNRVGLLLNVDYHGQCLLIVNVHLTFPHGDLDQQLRLTQMKEFLRLIDDYQTSKNLLDRCSIILCGDFNGPSDNDLVYQLIEQHFLSSFRTIHGREAQVTHLTHRHEELGVDFIFYRSSLLRVLSSELIPRGSNENKWNDPFDWPLSDHRAVLSTFQFNSHP